MKQELLTLGKKFKNMVVLSAGAAGGEMCEEFAKYFSDRYFNFGLAEANMVSAAAGFAVLGKMPLVVGDSGLLFTEAFSQILNDVCIPNLNVKFLGVGKMNDGFDLKIFPNLKEMEQNVEDAVEEYGPIFCKE